MKIRNRLLVLLLVTALVPMIAGMVMYRLGMHRLGSSIAEDTREVLVEQAHSRLKELVRDYSADLELEGRALETCFDLQVQAFEAQLAGPPPGAPPRAYSPSDFDNPDTRPTTMEPLRTHVGTGDKGDRNVIRVCYTNPVVKMKPGAEGPDLEKAFRYAWLAVPMFRRTVGLDDDAILWQYITLDAGVHLCYPGHGSYPDDYDPTTRPWYVEAVSHPRTPRWRPVSLDASTGVQVFTRSCTVHYPDGTLAGVMGMDVPLEGMYSQSRAPTLISPRATVMLLFVDEQAPPGSRILLLGRSDAETRNQTWRTPLKPTVLQSGDPTALQHMLDKAMRGLSSTTRMPFEGTDCLWACGASRPGQLIPMIVVPYRDVVARADTLKADIDRRTRYGLVVTGVLSVGFIVVVVLLSIVRARKLTVPVGQLTDAARNISRGQYHSRVNITTGDELETLGNVFNDMGVKLEERQRMKHSLALAMEIQQNLLPKQAPQVAGFDIAGTSLYCEETGGDYYDFIEMLDLGPDRLAVAVGDVTGHGIAAALMMASARGVLRSQAVQKGPQLGEVLEVLNRHLAEDSTHGRFMTLFYALLDGPSRTISWTSGGHDPALLLRHGDGRVDELTAEGLPLGVLPDQGYGRHGPLEISPGDVLLIGTDGIWEAMNDRGEQFGKDRLRRVMAEHAGAGAEALRTEVVHAVQAWQGHTPQADDITLVVVRAVPEE